jgi:hypothetical protein
LLLTLFSRIQESFYQFHNNRYNNNNNNNDNIPSTMSSSFYHDLDEKITKSTK